MEGDEYLEAIVAARNSREIDQDENVLRTLPFAAAALAIIFSLMVFIKSEVPDQLVGIYSIAIWSMLLLFWVAIGSALGFLLQAVSVIRPLQYLTDPDELYRYVTALRVYYTQSGTSDSEIEQRIIEDIRTLMIEQYTLGATHNQRVNEKRLRARARAFKGLIIAIIVALVAMMTMLGHKLAVGGSGGAITIQRFK